MSVRKVLKILFPGVQGLLNHEQAANLVLSLIVMAVDPVDSDTLRFLTRFFTPNDYNDLVAERAVAHRCGYPTCPNLLVDKKGQIRKLVVRSVVHPWSSEFCSRDCFRASEFYKHQLSTEALVTRRDVAFTPYGQSKYELNIILLDDVQKVANERQISLTEALTFMVNEQSQLEVGLQNLSLDLDDEKTGPGTDAGASEGPYGPVKIIENTNLGAPRPPDPERPSIS